MKKKFIRESIFQLNLISISDMVKNCFMGVLKDKGVKMENG